jgi:DHA3 family macrolide efflux protein-like MFS transporter
MVFKIVLTTAFSRLPLLVRDHFGGGAAQVSLIDAVVGGGIVAGGRILNAWGGFCKKVHTIILGTLGLPRPLWYGGSCPEICSGLP